MDEKTVDRLWPHIRWLAVLSEQGSFTSAARRLGVSKAAVSQRMAELERVAGVALIRRTTRRMHLTEAGQQLVSRTQGAYERIMREFSQIQDLRDAPAGVVRLTAPVALSRQHLVPLLPGFRRQYPEVVVELDMNDQLVSLATDGFDMAVRHVDAPPDVYVARRLSHTRTLLVASPDYLRRQGVPEAPARLNEHHCLVYERQRGAGAWMFEQIDRATGQPRRTSVPIQPRFAGNNSEILREMACAGAGIALVPDFSAADAVARGALVELLPGWRPVGTFGRGIYLLRPYSPIVPRALRVFWDYLKTGFPDRFLPAQPEHNATVAESPVSSISA